MSKLEEYIDQANEIDKGFGYGVTKPATEEQIQYIVGRAKTELNYDLTEDYLTFLRITNGFNFNGYFIHCIDGTSFYPSGGIASGKKMPGIIERTLFWRKDNDELKNWVFFGSSDMDLYVYNGDENEFWQYDVSGDVWGRFSTFTEMAEKMLSDALEY